MTSLQSEAAVFHSSSRPLNSGVLLKTETATVTSGSMSAVANVMLDEGSQRQFLYHPRVSQGTTLTKKRP